MTILRDLSQGAKAHEAETPSRQKQYQFTNRLHLLKQLIEARGGDLDRVAKELGYAGRPTVYKWLQDGEAPVVATLAAEALLRRLGTEARPVTFAAVVMRRGQSDAFLKVAEALGCTIAINTFVEGTKPEAFGALVLRIPVAHGESLRAVAKGFSGEFTTLEA